MRVPDRSNRPATPERYAAARAAADALARCEIERGASAVALAGSWARGDAYRHSDLDLWVVAARPGRALFVRDSFLVSVARKTAAGLRAELRDPALVGQVVPAWREVRILADPRGVAARLRERALRFRWGPISTPCDRYVARTMLEWGEEAVKLTRLVAEGHAESAAVQRNLLANALAGIVAVDRRMFYHENGLWEAVGRDRGGRWHRLQRRALGLDGGTFLASCRAALDLYGLTLDTLRAPLRARDRAALAAVRACWERGPGTRAAERPSAGPP